MLIQSAEDCKVHPLNIAATFNFFALPQKQDQGQDGCPLPLQVNLRVSKETERGLLLVIHKLTQARSYIHRWSAGLDAFSISHLSYGFG